MRRWQRATTGPWWHDDGIVLNTGSNANVVSFWQAMLGASSCLTIDGIYGTVTKNKTKTWQADIAHVTADGIVGYNTWLQTQFAQTPGPLPFYRLVNDGGGYWHYYTGTLEAYFYWNPANPYTGDMWLWKPFASSSSWYNSSPTSNPITPVDSTLC